MKYFLFFLLSFNAWALNDEGLRQVWLGRSGVNHRHAGYQDAENLRAPMETWQTLFSVALSSELHCVHAFIPAPKKSNGILRVVSVPLGKTCGDSWDASTVWEKTGLRSIQFSTTENEIKFWWSEAEGRVHTFKSQRPDVHGVFLYAPNTSPRHSVKVALIGEVQSQFPENPCSFVEGTCQLCRFGVYRVLGAKPEFYCGVDRCGEVNQPACPRGTKWQKSRGPFSCRGNQENTFCAVGLKVECLEEVAFCR